MRTKGIDLVKAVLLRDGKIEAYDAVYHLTEPDGTPHRITRLASTIHSLRHKQGWVIDTIEEPDRLATYVLRATPPGIESPRVARQMDFEWRLPE